MSLGCTPALASSWVTPALTPLRGRDGVDRVLSTTTRPLSASRRTTSVKVPPMSTPSRQSAIAVLLSDGVEDVHDPDLVVLGGVADEVAVALRHVLRPTGDVARAEGHALVRPDPEVELTGDEGPDRPVGRVGGAGGRTQTRP